jgi:hypothetical protein
MVAGCQLTRTRLSARGNLKTNLVMINCAAERCSRQRPMHLLHPQPPSINQQVRLRSTACIFRSDDIPCSLALANGERHALKRTYLTLLPHTQLVELCLAFEAYSPLHVKSSLWPSNLAAAVAELQLGPAPPSFQDTRKDITSGPVVNAPLTSVSPLPDAVTQASPTGTSTAFDPHLPSDDPNGDTTATGDQSSSPRQPQSSVEPISQPEPSTSLTKPSVTELPQGSYPHAPYGYPSTQSLPAYPHTPYYHYPPLNYPHNFPPQHPASYPHAPFPPSHTPFPPAVPLPRHPHPTGLPSTDQDDLPSYEDMLVEALTDLNESDGSAPKALFTWMASRYPLHTNFRPSASQALQKAFKRGRLEKGNNGRYRLNASWDGGSVRAGVLVSVYTLVDIFRTLDIQTNDTPTTKLGADGVASATWPSHYFAFHACAAFPTGCSWSAGS